LNRTSTKRLFPAGAIIDDVVSAIARLVAPLRDSKTIALLLFSCLLVYLVVVPLAVLVFGSFKAVAPGTPDYFTLNLTLENYARAFASRHLPKATVNTAIFAIGSSAIAFVLGTFLAWVTERTNSPFRSLLYVMAISRVILPGVLVTFSWIVF
jgi:iron(III) transport system permease protein